MFILEKCGKAEKVTSDVNGLACDKNNPCYCYGSISLQGPNDDECNVGKVYRSGKPVCNPTFSEKAGNVICNELGFYGVNQTSTETDGWVYSSSIDDIPENLEVYDFV